MRSITVRPVTPEDCTIGATVYASAHLDFVKEFVIVSARGPRETKANEPEDKRTLSVHCKSPLGNEWGFSFDKTDEDPTPRIIRLYNTALWYVEATCVGDTDGDGNCPLPGCPKCGEQAIGVQVIEPEGVIVTVQVFVPNEAIHLDDLEMRKARAKDMVEDLIHAGVEARGFEPSYVEIDHTQASLVSEEHIHIFDEDGVLLEADQRSTSMRSLAYAGGMTSVVSALGCSEREAQALVIRTLKERAAQQAREQEMHSRPRRGRPSSR